ncbi:hypothetical protein Tco_0998799 [Tanacetum coccineum]
MLVGLWREIKGTDGGYDARVLERNYVSNEPITCPNDDGNGPRRQASPSNHDAAIPVIPGCPLDNADVDQSGPSQVPAPPQNLPLVPVPLLPAAMLFPCCSRSLTHHHP